MSTTSKLSGHQPRLRLFEIFFLLAVAIMPVMQPAVHFGIHVAIISDIAIVLAGFAWLVSLIRGQACLRRTAFYVPLAIYISCSALATLFSGNASTSTVALLIDVYVVGIAVLTLNVLREPRLLRPFAKAWMTGTAITSLVGTIAVAAFYLGVRRPEVNIAISDFGGLPAGNYPRVTALFGNFNMACNYLSIGMLALLAMRRLEWLTRRTLWIWRALLAVTAAFTFSPGIGGLLLGVGLWLWTVLKRGGKRRLARLALATAVLAALAFVWAMCVSPNDLVTGGISSILLHPNRSARVECWMTALHTIEQHPLLGIGPGMAMPCPPWKTSYGRVVLLSEAHNVYLNTAALKGLLTLASFIGVLWYAGRCCRFRAFNGPAAVMTTVFSIAFVEAVLYQGIGYSLEHTRHTWVLMGALVSLGGNDDARPTVNGGEVTAQPTRSRFENGRDRKQLS